MRTDYIETLKRDYVEPMVAHVTEQFKISNATLILDVSSTEKTVVREMIKELEKANFSVNYIKEMGSLEVTPKPIDVACEIIFVNFQQKRVMKKLYLIV